MRSVMLLELTRLTLRYLRPYRRLVVLIALALVVDTAFSILFYYGVKVIIDDAVHHRANGLTAMLAGLGVFYVLTTVANVAREDLAAQVEVRLAGDLRLAVIAHAQEVSPDSPMIGQGKLLLPRLDADAVAIAGALSKGFLTLNRYTLQVVGCFGLLFVLEWRMALLTLCCYAVLLGVVQRVVRRSHRLGSVQGQHDSQVQTALRDVVDGYLVLTGFGLQWRAVDDVRRRLAAAFRHSVRVRFVGRLVTRAIDSGVTLTQLLVTGAGAYLALRQELSVGALAAYTGLLAVLGNAWIRLSPGVPDWIGALGPMRRVAQALAEPVGVVDSPDAQVLPPLRGTFRLEGVSCTYSGATRPALDGVSLTVPARQSVAIVGRNGAGKSTLLSLLLRLRDPDTGIITIDGHDLREVTRESLRSQISVVFQEPFLFNRSIRENIRVGKPEATDEEVLEVARAVQIDEVVRALPQGYDTVVGEGAHRLSGGQRQVITLARALLPNPAVLIMDEATSALAPDAEAVVQAILRRSAQGRTVIWITHRLSTVVDMDCVVVLDAGHVVEDGRHEELLAAGGLYCQMWEQQAGFLISADGRYAAVTPQRLQRIPMLAAVDEEALARLATQFVAERYEPGQVIVQEGEQGDTFYILVRGIAEALTVTPEGHEHVYEVLQDGDLFGEIALLADVPRTATVRANSPCLVLVLKRADFLALLDERPAVREQVARVTAERMGRLTAFAQQQTAAHGESGGPR